MFGGDGAAKSLLESSSYTLGVAFVPGTAEPSVGTYATTEVKDGVPTGNVTINMVGHFFNIRETSTNSAGQPVVRDWSMGTGLSDNDFRAFVLLHELGHLTGKLGDDTNNESLSNAFNQQIMTDCFGKKNWKP